MCDRADEGKKHKNPTDIAWTRQTAFPTTKGPPEPCARDIWSRPAQHGPKFKTFIWIIDISNMDGLLYVCTKVPYGAAKWPLISVNLGSELARAEINWQPDYGPCFWMHYRNLLFGIHYHGQLAGDNEMHVMAANNSPAANVHNLDKCESV